MRLFLIAAVFAAAADDLPVVVRLSPAPGGAVIRAVAADAKREQAFPAAGAETTIRLAPGQWFVDVVAPGFWSERVLVKDAQPLEVRLRPAATVVASIAAPKGSKIEHLAVHFEAVDQSFSGATVCRVGGDVASCDVPIGVLDLAWRAPGFASQYQWDVTVRAPRTQAAKVVLRRGSTFSGRVEWPDRRVKRDGATVAAWPASSAGQNDELRARAAVQRVTARTNARGFFSLDLAPGEYVVQARAGELVSEERQVIVIEGRESELRGALRLDKPRTLTVVVSPPVDPWNKPWRVELARIDEQGVVLGQRTLVAPADGVCLFANQLPGRYELHVRRTERDSWLAAPIELDHDMTFNAAVGITTIQGTIRLGKTPLAAWITFVGEGLRIPARAAADGVFRAYVPSVPDDTWPSIEIVSSKPPVQRTLERVKVVSATLDVELPATAIEGNVVDELGRPAPFALVTIAGEQGVPRQVESDDGRFSALGLAPGRYKVTAATKERETEAAQDVAIEDSEEPASVTLTVKPVARLHGVIRSSFGPVAGAAISAYPTGGWMPALLRVPVGPSGEFDLRLPPGTKDVTMAVTAPGYAFRMMRVPLTGEPVDVAVDQSGGALTVDVPRGADGRLPYLVHDGAVFSATAAGYLSGARTSNSARLRFEIAQTEAGGYSVCWLADAEVHAAASGVPPAGRCTSGLLSRQGSLVLTTP